MAISSNDLTHYGSAHGSAHGGSSGCDSAPRSSGAAGDCGEKETDRAVPTTPAPDFPTLVRAVAAAAAHSEKSSDSDSDETRTADSDTVLRAARLAQLDLWRAAFSLPGWLLLVFELAEDAQPYMRCDDMGASVLAFTDEFAALHYQAEHGLTFKAGFATSETPVDRSIELMELVAGDDPVDVIFNDGNEMFGAPIAMLRRLRRHVEHGDDPDALDATITRISGDATPIGPVLTAAARNPGSEDHARAIDALLALSDWWFVCNPNQPDAFHVRRFALTRDGRSIQTQAVVAFTAHRLAMESTDRYGLADRDGSIVLMQMPATDAVQWLQSFREHDVETVMFDALTTPFALRIEDLPGEWRSRHPEGESKPTPTTRPRPRSKPS